MQELIAGAAQWAETAGTEGDEAGDEAGEGDKATGTSLIERYLTQAALVTSADQGTGDPTGVWQEFAEVYGPGLFLDFPQLGMDLDAIIITVNVFTNDVFHESRLVAFDKAHYYNGIFFGSSLLDVGGGSCTMAPPFVLDNRPVAYVLSFCPGDTKVSIGSLTNSSRNDRRDADATATLRCVCRGIGPG